VYAPALFQSELANILLMAVRRRWITSKQRDPALSVFEQLRIRIDGPLSGQQISQVLKMADEYELTAYDATYLALAVRLQADLATLDKSLIKAGRGEGLRVFS
jgi:predicted nucleic acid-binding protein